MVPEALWISEYAMSFSERLVYLALSTMIRVTKCSMGSIFTKAT